MFRYRTQGWVDTASWQIIFRENYEILMSALSLPERRSSYYGIDTEILNRYCDSIQTFFHETIHFWHSISTNFLHSYSVNYLSRCLDVVESIVSRKISRSDIPLSEFQPYFNVNDVLLSPSESVRTIDVIEGCAVLCSFRMLESWKNSLLQWEVKMFDPQATVEVRSTHQSFLCHLQDKHFKQREYTSAYLLATNTLGDKAFDLFSPICYLALQGSTPGKNFVAILKWVKDNIDSFNVKEDLLSFLAQSTMDGIEGCFPSVVRQEGLPEGFSHPILQPYVQHIVQVFDIRVEDFFARPYYNFGIDYSSITPPMVLFYPNRMIRIMGIGAKLGKDYIKLINTLTAVVGLIKLLVYGIKDEMHCPHGNCPIYKTRLCQNYYNFPLNYKTCSFPRLLEEMKLENLLEK